MAPNREIENPASEFDYYCSNCRAVIDEDDKYCRQCGADTSETIDDSSEARMSTESDREGSTPAGELSIPRVAPQASNPMPPAREARSGLRSAAILLFVMAAFQFANQVVNNQGQSSGASSTLPVLANIVIGIGLLRPQGFWSMSQNGYRIWAIIRCLAVPVLIAIGVIEPTVSVTAAFILHSPELVIATGLLTILLGPPPLARRVALGVTLSVIGFIGSAIFIGLAST